MAILPIYYTTTNIRTSTVLLNVVVDSRLWTV
jgi:hypothetical protein